MLTIARQLTRAKPQLKLENGQVLPLPLQRFSVAQYQQMIDAGVFKKNDRVHLLEGWILEKMPHNPPHDSCVHMANDGISAFLPKGWCTRIQSSITTEDSQPEPDVAVVRGTARDYVAKHPHPRDIGMLVEVAHTTVNDDRGIQSRIYARARVPVYWIINIAARQVEVHTEPKGGRNPHYAECEIYSLGESVPLVLEGKKLGSIPVRDLLP